MPEGEVESYGSCKNKAAPKVNNIGGLGLLRSRSTVL